MENGLKEGRKELVYSQMQARGPKEGGEINAERKSSSGKDGEERKESSIGSLN